MRQAGQGKSPIRIGLVATDELRVAGLRALLEDGAGFEIVPLSEPRGLDMDGLDLALIDASATEHLDVLLESFRGLRPRVRLLVLSPDDGVASIEHAIRAGARGVLSPAATEAELLMAIEVVRDGSVWAPRKILSRMLDQSSEPAQKPAEVKLTRRELEVLKLLLQGFSNREIANALEVEEATVKAHMGRMMRKAGVGNRTALSVQARGFKWV